MAEAAAQESGAADGQSLPTTFAPPSPPSRDMKGIQDGIANTPEKQRHYLEIVYNKSVDSGEAGPEYVRFLGV